MQFSRRDFLLSVRFRTLSKVFCCCGALCQKTSAKIWLTELNQSHRIYALDKLARGWDVPQFHSETDRTITTSSHRAPGAVCRCGLFASPSLMRLTISAPLNARCASTPKTKWSSSRPPHRPPHASSLHVREARHAVSAGRGHQSRRASGRFFSAVGFLSIPDGFLFLCCLTDTSGMKSQLF